MPFWLKGNLAPTFSEITVSDLPVSGVIPPELSGAYMRNGPNPPSGRSAHWFLGSGMLHSIELRGGRAGIYRNRYVRTMLFESGGEPRLDETGAIDRRFSLANTHVIRHAGKIMALEEASWPWLISKDLETLGPHDFGGKLKTAMSAHPRICPVTGELLFFGYNAVPPYLTYHRVSADGELVQSEEITLKAPPMMHDWNITRNFVIFMDLPLLFDLSLLTEKSIQDGTPPLRWLPERGARLGVMPRRGCDADVVWYDIDPCYVFHPMNAYEEGDTIVIDVARFPHIVLDEAHFPKTGFGPEEPDVKPAVLHRWIVDRAQGKVRECPLDDRPAEFPRVADSVVGLKHRYGYMMATIGGDVERFGQALYKFDLQTGQSWTWNLPPGETVGEPAHAAVGSGEDEGYILSFVYDRNRGASDLVILDAAEFHKGPIARVHLPVRVPEGFHGSWIPDA
jgi:carotenoid cleavage dioxygenase